MEHAGQIDRDDAVPLAGIEVEKTPAMTDPGTVEQHIEPAELAYAEPDCSRAPATRANGRRGSLGQSGVNVSTGNRCTLAPETGRASAADPAGRTGDQCYLPLDPAIAKPALISSQDHIGAALRSNYGLRCVYPLFDLSWLSN
jgi:hypothetical protein